MPTCPGQATQRGLALPLTCLLPDMLSRAPCLSGDPRNVRLRVIGNRLVLRRASSCGH